MFVSTVSTDRVPVVVRASKVHAADLRFHYRVQLRYLWPIQGELEIYYRDEC
jgi:hypothetical protein